jgi:hypothetical protein
MNALYSLYDALVSINVPSEKARAVVDAMERDMTALLATKSDLALLESRIDSLDQKMESRFSQMETKMDLLRSSMTVRLGSMLITGFAVLFAALKLTA